MANISSLKKWCFHPVLTSLLLASPDVHLPLALMSALLLFYSFYCQRHWSFCCGLSSALASLLMLTLLASYSCSPSSMYSVSTGSGVPAVDSSPAVPFVSCAAVGPAVDVFSQLLPRPWRSAMNIASTVVASLLLLRYLLLMVLPTFSWRSSFCWYPCFCWLLAVVGFPAVAVSLLWL